MDQDGMRAFVFSGKAEHLLPGIADGSVDAVITDPPYGLAELKPDVIVKALTAWLGGDRMHVPDGRGFMGKDWDRFVPPPGIWDECYRALKPGGHMAVFAGARTADLMGMSVRLAGFEARDTLCWLYGTGFPKSRTHLKPAQEPILVCRKPFPGSEAANVLAHGTGALNPAACMVGSVDKLVRPPIRRDDNEVFGKGLGIGVQEEPAGRWAPNLLLTHAADCQPAGTTLIRGDARAGQERGTRPGGFVNTGSEGGNGRPAGVMHGDQEVQAWSCAPGCPVAGLDAQSGMLRARGNVNPSVSGGGTGDSWSTTPVAADHGPGDAGGASRFFPQFTWDPEYDLPFLYQAKAPKSERPQVEGATGHPTVKPLALMRWLARLLCPPDGLILDPFGGTMTTVQAALLEDFRAVAADSWPSAIEHAQVRLAPYGERVVFG